MQEKKHTHTEGGAHWLFRSTWAGGSRQRHCGKWGQVKEESGGEFQPQDQIRGKH